MNLGVDHRQTPCGHARDLETTRSLGDLKLLLLGTNLGGDITKSHAVTREIWLMKLLRLEAVVTEYELRTVQGVSRMELISR